jgi:hypothetical protein
MGIIVAEIPWPTVGRILRTRIRLRDFHHNLSRSRPPGKEVAHDFIVNLGLCSTRDLD